MNKRPLILGVDPGMTTGFALVDFSGNVVATHSRKELTKKDILFSILPYGKVLVVSTDKKKAPQLVSEVATKLGARLMTPPQDLSKEEKKKLVNQQASTNDHEDDAIASALYAFHQLQPLINKVNQFCHHHKKEGIKSALFEQALKTTKNLKEITQRLEQPEQKEVKQKPRMTVDENGILKQRIKHLEEELFLIREYNRRLKKQLREKEKPTKLIQKHTSPQLEQKKELVLSLVKQMKRKEQQNLHYKKKIDLYQEIIAKLSTHYLVKRLRNFGHRELKQFPLPLSKGDILLVDDPTIINAKVIRTLKEKIQTVIVKKDPGNTSLPFTFILSHKLHLHQYGEIALVSKHQLDKERNSKQRLYQAIIDYQSRDHHNPR